MMGDFFYAIEVYNTAGTLVAPAALEQQLHAVLRDYHARVSSGEKASPLGIMTTDDRDSWAAVSIML